MKLRGNLKKNKIPKLKKVKNSIKGLTEKEAAEKLNCSYEIVLELIEKHGLSAKRRGKGWQIDPDELEKFSSANQELIRFLKSRAKRIRAVYRKIIKNKKGSRSPFFNLLFTIQRVYKPFSSFCELSK